MAVLILPPLENGDQVFPALIGELLPVGLRGLVLAALMAALMSSIDSTLNAASALLTLDFIKPMRPGLTPRQIAWIGRGAIGLFMVLSAAIAPLVGNFEGLFHYLQTALAYLVPPVAALFFLGALWRRPGPGAALATLIGGHSLSMALFALNIGGLFEMHFTLVAGILFGVSLLILILAGLILPPGKPAPNSVWTPDMARPELAGPWWADYRAQALVLLLLTIALVWAFR